MACEDSGEGLIKRLLPSVGWRTCFGLFWWDGGGAILFYIRPKPVYRYTGPSQRKQPWNMTLYPDPSQLKSTHPSTEAYFWPTEYTQQAESSVRCDLSLNIGGCCFNCISLALFYGVRYYEWRINVAEVWQRWFCASPLHSDSNRSVTDR